MNYTIKNLEVSWRCLKEREFRQALTHFLNSFLRLFNIWIIHPEPTMEEQNRIFEAYKNSNNFAKSINYVLTLLIWFKTPESLSLFELHNFRKHISMS